MEKITSFVNWAKDNGWNITLKDSQTENLPQEILGRYNIPGEYKTFVQNIEVCTNAAENVWFLCIEEYLPKSEDSFRWNEFELISLGAADDDSELINDVKNYWDKHLPIIMSVKNGYEYYAINIESKEIVYGYEPEFEENETVGNNFEEFLEKIIRQEIKL
ncbi:MAG: SMI1/KNR4 family protein [Spirochaetes bacterium]|nr:SMI1/KNR4 family protein [Spirochaetota bacterium]